MAPRWVLSPGELFEDISIGEGSRFQIACFNENAVMIGISLFSGSEPGCFFPQFRAIVSDARVLDATSIVVAHNHKIGETTPNKCDYEFTQRLVSLVKALGIRMDDHLIFCGNEVFSFGKAGLL